MKNRRSAALIAGMATLALLLPAVPAHAATVPDNPADAVADTVAEASPTDIVAADLEAAPGGVAASLEGGGETHLAIDPSNGIAVTSAEGIDVLAFSLPGAARLDDAVIADDGSVTYLRDAKTRSRPPSLTSSRVCTGG